jgi:hypothetical protein
MRDTSPAAERARIEAIRRMDPVQRMRQALEFSEVVRQVALARLHERYPERTRLELVELMLGEPLLPPSQPPRT